jgi:uncharacterized damage-inducible protein DinB
MLTPTERTERIQRIQDLPQNLRAAVNDLSDAQLDTPYRDGGWTVRQLVHHVADSHFNAVVRLRLALSEDHPTIKPYNQDAWAKQADYALPVELSLTMLDSLHTRWTVLWKSLAENDFARTLNHSENGTMSVDDVLNVYAAHGDKHVAHITHLRTVKGW